MTSNKSIFILLFPLLVIASECPDDFIAIDNSCFYKKHLDVLQDFIDENQILHGMQPQDIDRLAGYPSIPDILFHGAAFHAGFDFHQ